ncbi:MAG: CGNR zinc finger domain-containing protein [Rubrobacter sp.]|nr:CGNR zinc finger domain-containing protein [Rubrobacter sp.]
MKYPSARDSLRAPVPPKNRSGSWCNVEICGSRAKMRAYRRRRSSGTS